MTPKMSSFTLESAITLFIYARLCFVYDPWSFGIDCLCVFTKESVDENDHRAFYESSEDSDKEPDGLAKPPIKKPYVMDSDHRLLLRTCRPLLNSRNAAVRMSWKKILNFSYCYIENLEVLLLPLISNSTFLDWAFECNLLFYLLVYGKFYKITVNLSSRSCCHIFLLFFVVSFVLFVFSGCDGCCTALPSLCTKVRGWNCG